MQSGMIKKAIKPSRKKFYLLWYTERLNILQKVNLLFASFSFYSFAKFEY